MPISPPRPCAHIGCKVLVHNGNRCELHRKEWIKVADTRRDRGPRVYDKRIWRDKIRPAQLRQQPLCEHCLGNGRVSPATDVDHIDGDPTNNRQNNLQSLCHSCHSSKTSSQNGGFGNRQG